MKKHAHFLTCYIDCYVCVQMWSVSSRASIHEQTQLPEKQKQVRQLSVSVYINLSPQTDIDEDHLFFCRNGLGPPKEGEPQYVVVHCTGYIKSWPPAGNTVHSTIHRKCLLFTESRAGVTSIQSEHNWNWYGPFILFLFFSGVTLSEEEADNNQGNRFCLVAIGRLQVLPLHFISVSNELVLCHIWRNNNSVIIYS